MTKEELLAYTDREIRTTAPLLESYKRLYKEENGKEPSCTGCSFSSIIQQWRLTVSPKHKKKQMTATKNTFTLKEKVRIPVPFSGGEVITETSEDQLVIDYINHKYQNVDATPAMKQARANNFFELPEGFSLDGENTDDEMSLKELRVKHADKDIKATSKKGFLEKLAELESNSEGSDEEE